MKTELLSFKQRKETASQNETTRRGVSDHRNPGSNPLEKVDYYCRVRDVEKAVFPKIDFRDAKDSPWCATRVNSTPRIPPYVRWVYTGLELASTASLVATLLFPSLGMIGVTQHIA